MKKYLKRINPTSVKHPPPKPLMIYDGDCGFCRKWVNRWKFLTRDKVAYGAYQKVAVSYPEIPKEDFEKSVHLVEPDGRVWRGAQAVFRTLGLVPVIRWVLWAHDHVPGFAFIAENLYSFIAGHRQLFSKVDSCGMASADKPSAYFLSRWFFLKALSLTYLVAFGSLCFQIRALVGSQGILPFRFLLSDAQAELSWKAYCAFPTLCWLNDSDGFLLFLCGGGILLSALLFLDLFPALCLFFLWVFYLSLVTLGQDFLGFQWDNLLLEAGFLSIFLVPLSIRLKNSSQVFPPRIVIFLFQWLLFRLMFSSGFVKWASGDAAWRGLTALRYHYETQPLPTPLAWYMNQLPGWFQGASCLYLFGVELAVPFMIFGPRRFRPAVFWVQASLQVLILLTGNYCFFNFLTLALCLFVLEDEAWPKGWREKLLASPWNRKSGRDWPAWIRTAMAAVILFLSAFQMNVTLGGRGGGFLPGRELYEALEPFRSVNGYGLFAVMTTTRPEIIVEGSNDRKYWRAYEFKWKAGDLGTAPHWASPYQPRLDCQMWFAALENYRQNPWFLNFLFRLLQGSPGTLSLLKTNPFPETPPQFIRAQLYEYHFTNFTERNQTGNWWKREFKGAYLPPISIKDISGR